MRLRVTMRKQNATDRQMDRGRFNISLLSPSVRREIQIISFITPHSDTFQDLLLYIMIYMANKETSSLSYLAGHITGE